MARARAVEATSDEGVVLAAEAEGNVAISKYNSEGVVQWTHSEDGIRNAEGLAVAPNGDVVWGGWIMDEEYEAKAAVGKLSPSGDPLWSVAADKRFDW